MFLSNVEQISLMRKWIDQGQPFFHTRYNDGECNGMFRLVPPTATTSGEHHHFRDLGGALLTTFEALAKFCIDQKPNNVIIGSYSQAGRNLDDTARVFLKFLNERGWLDKLPWGAGDLWYSTQLEERNQHIGNDLIKLIDKIRTTSNLPKVLVGNSTIRKCAHCLGAQFIEIPGVDAWLSRDRIYQQCAPLAQYESLFVWCGGLPSKVFMWNLWKDYPVSSHIDAGHLFDVVAGVKSRMWHHRPNSAHLEFCKQVFIPYVERFIP